MNLETIKMNSTSALKDISYLQNSRGLSSAPFSSASFVLSAVLICGALLISIRSLKKKLAEPRRRRNKGEIEEEDGEKKLENIPIYSALPSTLPMGLRLPSIIETLFLAPKIKAGMKAFDESYDPKYVNEPIIKVPLLTSHVLGIKCPNLIQKLLMSSNPHVLNKPKFFDWLLPKDLRDGLFSSSENKIWQHDRKMLSGCFSYKAIQSLTGKINKHGRQLVAYLLTKSSKNDGTIPAEEINEAIYFHLFNTIAEMVLGEGTLTEEENRSFRFHFTQQTELLTHKILNPHNLLPFIWWLNPKKKALDGHFSSLREHVSTVYQRSKEKCFLQQKTNTMLTEEKDRHRSIIEEMIASNVPEERILCHVYTFLVGGHDTTNSGLQHFLQHIAEHTDIQILCQAEVDSIFQSKTDSDSIAMDDLANLKYLERCILETLRLTSVSPLLFRQLSAPLDLDGYRFKEGTTFIFPTWAIHRDPKFYPNPEKFDPDRFLPENVAKRNPYSFLPFSHGPRNCIAYKVAMMEMKIILGWILRHFNVSTSDRLEDVPIKFDIKTTPQRGYYNIKFHKRDL